jgi:hypothetical protein
MNERTGLIVASLILGGACWSSSVKMVAELNEDDRTELLKRFKLYANKLHSELIAEWIVENW